ncbi:hypothetical protein [Streptomyces sp. NPDC012888]|uniref:hypothetical protein n=1 Tax=Streptomyces sp. NPDC012888 TaxID=3364855 RepID=UPI00369B8B50
MTSARVRAGALLTVAILGGCAVPAAASESLITVIDNSHADSVLEVDRTANVQSGSGTAGSDHDGSAVEVLDTLVQAVHSEAGD